MVFRCFKVCFFLFFFPFSLSKFLHKSFSIGPEKFIIGFYLTVNYLFLI